jgi:hypothetical protein
MKIEEDKAIVGVQETSDYFQAVILETLNFPSETLFEQKYIGADALLRIAELLPKSMLVTVAEEIQNLKRIEAVMQERNDCFPSDEFMEKIRED